MFILPPVEIYPTLKHEGYFYFLMIGGNELEGLRDLVKVTKFICAGVEVKPRAF